MEAATSAGLGKLLRARKTVPPRGGPYRFIGSRFAEIHFVDSGRFVDRLVSLNVDSIKDSRRLVDSPVYAEIVVAKYP